MKQSKIVEKRFKECYDRFISKEPEEIGNNTFFQFYFACVDGVFGVQNKPNIGELKKTLNTVYSGMINVLFQNDLRLYFALIELNSLVIDILDGNVNKNHKKLMRFIKSNSFVLTPIVMKLEGIE